ncbi:MAG: methyl-accepting chemotaxis protein [Rubripirellula sp.]
MIESLTHACSTTERAAMAIGDQISALFEIARTNNESASESISGVIGRNTQSSSDVLSEDAQRVISIAALLENQRRGIESFVQKTQEFFQQHTQLANESEERIQKMESSVSTISKIAVGSRILAINAQIESARLGEAGRAFAVVSKQMKSFSDDTKNANNLIDASVASVSDLMSRVRSGTREMESSLSEFATVLAAEVEEIEARTDTLMELLSNTLCQIEESNVHLTASSRTALSELQFQDPLSQNLQRMVHDVKKLQSLLETGECEDFDLAEIDPTVGNDGSLEREAGEIEFF